MNFENQEQNQIEQERRFQERIDAIKDLQIGPVQKAEIMLVILGLKPATELSLYKNNDAEDKVEDALRRAGLEVHSQEIIEHKNLVADIAVAQDQDTLERIIKANADQDHEEYGRLMGYPETAIQAFNANNTLDDKEEAELEKGIFSIKYSKDNWAEEKAVVQEWNEAIKKYAPETYEEAGGTLE